MKCEIYPKWGSRVDRFHSLEARVHQHRSIERVNRRSMPTVTWHRSRSFRLPFRFPRNWEMPLNHACLGIWAEDARKTWIQARGLMLKCVACPWYKSLFTGTLRSVYAACFRSGCFPRGREKRGRFFSFLPPSYPAPSFRSCFSSFLITFPFETFPRNVSLLRALNP